MRFVRSNLESPFDFWKAEENAVPRFGRIEGPEAEDLDGIPLAPVAPGAVDVSFRFHVSRAGGVVVWEPDGPFLDDDLGPPET